MPREPIAGAVHALDVPVLDHVVNVEEAAGLGQRSWPALATPVPSSGS